MKISGNIFFLYCVQGLSVPEPSARLYKVHIVTIGDISNSTSTSLPLMAPAIDTAMEELRRLYNETVDFVHTYLYDTKIKNAADLPNYSDFMVADWYYRRKQPSNVTSFIIPGALEDINLNRLAAGWNTLLITSGSYKPVLRNKRLSPTWITTGCCSAFAFAKFFMNIFAKYNWTSIYLICDEGAFTMYSAIYGSLAAAIAATGKMQLDKKNINTTAVPNFSFVGLLQEFRRVSRVFVYLGNARFVRQLLIQASEANMTNGEYVYLVLEAFHHPLFGNFTWYQGDAYDQIARKAFSSLIKLSLVESINVPGPKAAELASEWKNKSKSLYNYTYKPKEPLIPPLPITYYSFMIFGQIVSDLILNKDFRTLESGRDLAKKFSSRNFSVDGTDLYMDDVGERRTDMVAMYYSYDTNSFQDFLFMKGATFSLEEVRNVDWYGNSTFPPNEPRCGFMNNREQCIRKGDYSVIYGAAAGALGFIVLLAAIATIYVRFHAAQVALQETWWILDQHQLVYDQPDKQSSSSADPWKVVIRKLEIGRKSFLVHQEIRTGKATVNNKVVWVDLCTVVGSPKKKTLENTGAGKPTRQLMNIIQQLREASHHDNINKFLAVATIRGFRATTVFLSGFAEKGSLHDLLDSRLQLDWDFKNSFIYDLIMGFNYIHSSPLGYHGHFGGWSCLFDKTFTLMIGRLAFERLETELYGVPPKSTDEAAKNREKLYAVAPEVRAGGKEDRRSDIYSVGVVFYEIIYFEFPPYLLTDLTGEGLSIIQGLAERNVSTVEKLKVLEKIRTSTGFAIGAEIQFDDIPPPVENFDEKREEKHIPLILEKTMEACWSSNPDRRPTAVQLRTNLKDVVHISSAEMRTTKRGNKLVDKILHKLETAARELEADVLLRTTALVAERAKCDTLLREVLPKQIVEQLRKGLTVDPELFESVTIMFSGIVGFMEFVGKSTPLMVTNFLNSMYSAVDPMLEEFDVYKVETISDSYMVASGLPVRGNLHHAREICSLALIMMQRSEEGLSPYGLKLKIGVHSGGCAAAVVGTNAPRYCLFGDTINTASRMCSLCEPNRIHTSTPTAEIVQFYPLFQLQPRGLIEVKGKGLLATFWLERPI